MTQTLLPRRISAVAHCLRQVVPDPVAVGAERWRFVLGDSGADVSVALEDEFLCFDAPAPLDCAPAEWLRWLEWTPALSGNAKFVLRPQPWRLHLRAEVPLDEKTGLAGRIGGSVRGLTEAASLLAGNPCTPTLEDHPASRSDVVALLRETGWSFRERPDGAASVEIATRGDSTRVLVEPSANGLRAAMELACVDSQSASCAQALSVLLLSAAGAIRLARPYAERSDEQFSYGFEVRLSGVASAPELERALDALAVAGWLCKQEVQCLLDNSMAESYLAIRQLPPCFAREEFFNG